MDPRMQCVSINDDITLLNDHNEATSYLVTGTERALLIDTANGWVDMQALCAELTDLPVTVVNTHGHIDHVLGNVYFAEAYLHPADVELHHHTFANPKVRELMEPAGLRPAKLLPLSIGQVFDLGGGHALQVVALPGHTAGSVGLLDRKYRILFSGDGVISHLWMQLPESLPMETLRETLRTLKREHGSEFDWLLTGHGRGLEPASRIDGLLAGCEQLIDGDPSGDRPYRWFMGECLIHPYDDDPDHGIVYDPDRQKGSV